MSTPSIWKGKNTAHIVKTGIEYTIALASLAAAITTVLIATNVIAVPESLALVSTIVNPIGIAALFIIAAYFFMQAISSHQQMHRNEEINGAKTSEDATTKEVRELIQNEIEAKTKDLATKAELNKKADKVDVDAELAKKANASALNAKADKSYVDDQLARKANASALETKVDKTEVIPTVLNLSESDVKQFKQILGLQEQVI